MGTMDRDNVKQRHVWVDSSGGYRHPGLVITWRRSADGEWKAYVATTPKFGCALVTWAPALSLHPVTDDRWEEPHPPTR